MISTFCLDTKSTQKVKAADKLLEILHVAALASRNLHFALQTADTPGTSLIWFLPQFLKGRMQGVYIFILSAVDVHEKCEPQVGGQGRAARCDNDKLAVGFRGAFSLLRFFLQKKK